MTAPVEGNRAKVIPVPRRGPGGAPLPGQYRGYVLEVPNTKGLVRSWFREREVSGTTLTGVVARRLPGATVEQTGKLPEGAKVAATKFVPDKASERRRVAAVYDVQGQVVNVSASKGRLTWM